MNANVSCGTTQIDFSALIGGVSYLPDNKTVLSVDSMSISSANTTRINLGCQRAIPMVGNGQTTGTIAEVGAKIRA
jgi:hypothetical protein